MAAAVVLATLGAGCSQPRPTQTAADFDVGSYQGAIDSLELSEPAGDGELAMPHLAFTITGVGEFESLPAQAVDDLGLEPQDGAEVSAPEGSEFVVATLERSLARWVTLDAPELSSVDIGIGDDTTSVTVFDNASETTVVAVAPRGADALITITDAGESASIDMRTGQRVAELTPANTSLYYPLASPLSSDSTLPAFAQFPQSGAAQDADPTGIALDAVRPSLEPWTPEMGWAPPELAWLAAEGLVLEMVNVMPPLNVDLRPKGVLTVTPDGGTAAAPDQIGLGLVEGLTYKATVSSAGFSVAVPVEARAFTFTFSPAPTESATGTPYGTWLPGTAVVTFA